MSMQRAKASGMLRRGGTTFSEQIYTILDSKSVGGRREAASTGETTGFPMVFQSPSLA